MSSQPIDDEELKINIEKGINAIRSTDVLTRMRGVDSLTQIGSPAVESVILLLKDKNIKDKREIAEALGKIKDERAIGSLVDLVDTWIRSVEKYLSTGDLLDRDIEAEFNAFAGIRALAEFGEKTLPYLETISKMEGLVWGGISKIAVEEVAAVRRKLAGKPDLRGFLVTAEFADEKSRIDALNQLAEIGDESALPGLEKLAEKFQGADKELIRTAIGKIKQRLNMT
ncbi:HEAT repeat domain-containing protein [bacterium]|nr:HEAT repeat domain-containing protein [bacterium]